MMKYKPIQVHAHEHNVEKSMEKVIRNAFGGYVIKNQATGRTGTGKPDLSACIKGLYYAFEMKRTKGSVKTTPAQVKNLKDIAKAGGYAFWAKSDDLEDLLNDKLKQKKVIFENLNIDDIRKLVTHYLNQKQTLFIQYMITGIIIYFK